MEQTQSLKQLILDIDDKKIFLPEFQRDFVWEISKTYDLFDSLVKDIFIGAIIYGIPSFDIAIREIDNRKKITKGKKRPALEIRTITKKQIEDINKIGGNFRLVLDGQQRTTSIYRALKGTDEVWFVAKNEDEVQSTSFENAKLEDLLEEIAGEQDAERLSIKLSDAWDIELNDYDEEEIKEKFFFQTSYYKTYCEDDGFDVKSEFKKYRNLRRKVADLFKSEKLLSFYLLDMNLEKFVVFFERSNTRGVQLNFIDILAAKLYTGNFNLKEKIKYFEQQNPNYNLVPEIIVRSIAYIKSSPKEINRNFILTSLNADDFKEWWDKLCKWYKVTLDYLFQNSFIISQDWMPYENMVIPLMNFLKEIGGDFHQMNPQQKKFIDYWYWNSVFSLRYSGSSNERIIEDSNILIQIARGKKINSASFFNKLSKIQILSAEDIYSFDKKANAVYKGILNLINFEKGGLLNWNNDAKLSINSVLEDHHIFPKNYLHNALASEAEKDLIDCVANRTLIPKIQNIKISDQTPSAYLAEIKVANPEIEKSLENHLITKELLNGEYDKEFNFFLEPSRNFGFHEHMWPAIDQAMIPFPETDAQATAIARDLDPSIAVIGTIPLGETAPHGGVCVTPEGGGTIRVRIDGLGIGHKFPTGSAMDRRAWVELIATNAANAVVFQSGVVPDGMDPEEIADPNLKFHWDQAFKSDDTPAHFFWEIVRFDASQLLAQPTTLDKNLPEFDHSTKHLYVIGGIVNQIQRITVRVRMRALPFVVLRDLVSSGDLDVSFLDKVPTLDVSSTNRVWDRSLPTDLDGCMVRNN